MMATYERNFTFPGTSIDFPYTVIVNDKPRFGDVEISQNPTLYMHGYAEGPASAERIVEEATASGIQLVMPRIDFSQLRDRGAFGSRNEAVQRVAKELCPHILSEISEEHGDNKPINSVAYSMGAMMLKFGIDETDGEFTSDVAVVNGMGTSTDPEIGRLHRSRPAYLARFAGAMLSGTGPQEGYLGGAFNIVRTITRDSLKSRTFAAQMTIANETSTIESYIIHARRGNRVDIVTGEKDWLYKATDVIDLFEKYKQGLEIPTLNLVIEPGLTHQDGGMDKARAAIVRAAKNLSNS